MSAELVVATAGDAVPTLAQAEERLAALVRAVDAGALDEVRVAAEAHRFYEERAENRERADHFNRLALMSEAALGLLSFDHPEVNAKHDWRVLAAAYERSPGALMSAYDACARRTSRLPRTTGVAYEVRCLGFGSVPRRDVLSVIRVFCASSGVSEKEFVAKCRPVQVGLSAKSFQWRKARRIAQVAGVDARTFPPDPAFVKAEEERKAASVRHSQEAARQRAKIEAEEQRELNRRATRRAGKALDRAHSLIMRAAQELNRAKDEADNGVGWGRPRDLEGALLRLYDVEDDLGRIAREGPPPDRTVPLLPVIGREPAHAPDAGDAALIADGFREQETRP